MTSAFSSQNSISLCTASFCTPRVNLPVTPWISWLSTFAFQSPIMKIEWIQFVLSLEGPLDCKEIMLVNPKGNQSWIFIGRTDAEAPILWPPDVNNWHTGKDLMLGKIEGRRRRERQSIRWLDSITYLIDMSLNKLWEMLIDREVLHAAVHMVANSRTRLSTWTELMTYTFWILFVVWQKSQHCKAIMLQLKFF